MAADSRLLVRRSRSVTIKLGEPFDWASLDGWVVKTAWTLMDGALYMIVQEVEPHV